MITQWRTEEAGHGKDKEMGEVFPVYFRVPFLIVFGTWCWGINLKGLAATGEIDYAYLFEMRREEAPSHVHIFHIASVFSFILSTCFYLFSQFSTSSYLGPLFFPMLLYVLFAYLIFVPDSTFYPKQRQLFLIACWRILAAPFYPVYYADIVLADIFTSFAKVFGDLESAFCLMFKHSSFETNTLVKAGCINPFIGPAITALPALWRFFQCMRQFRDEKGDIKHIKNAIKYCSAFPVIITSALQKHYSHSDSAESIFLAWVISGFIHAMFSFYWDVVYDWDLFHSKSKRFLLRDRVVFKPVYIYYIVILLDLALRMTWSLKLSSHLHIDAQLYIFLLEMLEILRRTVWIFFRMEHQHIKLVKASV